MKLAHVIVTAIGGVDSLVPGTVLCRRRQNRLAGASLLRLILVQGSTTFGFCLMT